MKLRIDYERGTDGWTTALITVMDRGDFPTSNIFENEWLLNGQGPFCLSFSGSDRIHKSFCTPQTAQDQTNIFLQGIQGALENWRRRMLPESHVVII